MQNWNKDWDKYDIALGKHKRHIEMSSKFSVQIELVCLLLN